MLRAMTLLVLLCAACGRLGYTAEQQAGVSDAGASDAGTESDGALLDAAGIDAVASIVIDVESTTHRLGDGTGAEGTFFEKPFTLDVACTSALIELEIPGFGPNLESPPEVSLNSMVVGDFTPFFPPVDESDPDWQTNPCGSHDYNGGMFISMDATGFTIVGENLFRLQSGRSDDDYQFQNVVLRCFLTP